MISVNINYSQAAPELALPHYPASPTDWGGDAGVRTPRQLRITTSSMHTPQILVYHQLCHINLDPASYLIAFHITMQCLRCKKQEWRWVYLYGCKVNGSRFAMMGN